MEAEYGGEVGGGSVSLCMYDSEASHLYRRGLVVISP
jgi:hypothetical protein